MFMAQPQIFFIDFKPILRKEHGPYISLNLKIGGRTLIDAWGLKVINTVLQQHCHPLALLTIKVKDPESKIPS